MTADPGKWPIPSQLVVPLPWCPPANMQNVCVTSEKGKDRTEKTTTKKPTNVHAVPREASHNL